MPFAYDYEGLATAWLIGAAVVSVIAGMRGRNALGFGALSLVLSPVIGLVVLLATGDGQERAECWQCKERVLVGASKCRFCGADLVWDQSPPGTE